MKKSLPIAILLAMILLPILGVGQGDTTTKKDTIFSCCDETPRSADSIEALGFIFVDTCCSTIWQRWPDGRFSCCPTKKDTILVGVACVVDAYVGVFSDFTMIKKAKLLELRQLKQERTIEWQTWHEGAAPNKNGWDYAITIQKSDWVITKTNWLESVEGCYQLTLLKD